MATSENFMIQDTAIEIRTKSYPNDGVMVEMIREALQNGVAVKFRVTGGSMSPFVKNRDVVVVQPASGGRAGFGRILVVFHPRQRRLILHRVIGQRRLGFLLKGDRNGFADGWVCWKDVLGVVAHGVRGGRKVSLGFGIERFVIGVLSRWGLLHRWLAAAGEVRGSVFRPGKG